MTRKSPALFLQRLARHLRAQDWTAAAIEFVLVVVGVFMGFQLTQWNEDRVSRAHEKTLMRNVARDLRDDVEEMDENVRTASSRMASLDHLLRLAGDWNPPKEFPSSRFSIQVEQVAPFDPKSEYRVGIEAFILSFYDGNRFAYEALINNDGVNVVQDQERLSEIQKYYALVDQLLTFEQSLAENRLRMLDAMQAEGISAVDGSSFEKVAQVVRQRPALRAAIENYWFYANRQVFLTKQLSAEADRLADEIEADYPG
ncbi:hypothetical protein [Qipengyuania soli]|uniref:Uncharacterized protein n=1 Tax=Qipengyuania soli TaxID=2782568 RepID=A0A7S8F4A3_9SPHN|nr:hypothetical protein [Qipengyuania soli]QPD00191.1 hypothetical protein IRL76_06595 [Qipengyuania soli]